MSNVRSHLIYGSQIWCPQLLKDIKRLEQVQRRATRFILQGSNQNYRERLVTLGMLPLSMWLELQDVLFAVKSMKDPSDNFNIFDHIRVLNSITRSTSRNHLAHNFCRTTTARHFYFNRVVRIWNKLPEINLEASVITTKTMLISFFWSQFLAKFDLNNVCSFHLCCPCSQCFLSSTY